MLARRCCDTRTTRVRPAAPMASPKAQSSDPLFARSVAGLGGRVSLRTPRLATDHCRLFAAGVPDAFCLRRRPLCLTRRRQIGDVPAAWTRFQSAVRPRPFPTSAVIFMHKMRSHNGNERLVAVVVDGSGWIASFIFDLGSWRTLPIEVKTSSSLTVRSLFTPRSAHRFYAGQIDPHDPSHFAFRVDTAKDGVKLFDGYLQNDDGLRIIDRSVANQSPFWMEPPPKPEPIEI